MSSWSGRLVRLLAVGALVSAASVVPMTQAVATEATTPSTGPGATTARPGAAGSSVAWKACSDGFDCARVRVPLDYDHPHGRQISLALVRLPATDPAHRIGSLFVNPGGPGGSGVDFVLDAGRALFTPAVRARFDIVGFDPRGVNRSTPLRCFDTQRESDAVLPRVPYPNTRAERRTWVATERTVDAACVRRAGPILDHMSTADVARDLDRLRRAVGDRRLTYYGVSYGSFLGNVYANLFPRRFRALVIDGVLDPVAWTTGRKHQGRKVPFSTRLHSARGARATLHEFLRLCDAGGTRCAFGPHAARRYAQLYRTLRRNPLVLPQPDGSSVRYDETFLVSDTLGAMYDSSSWPDLADYLAELASRADAATLSAHRQLLRVRAEAVDYVNQVESFPGVACSDSVNPRHYRAWDRAAATSRRRDGIFGPLWTWVSSICADWPGHDRDRYLGPFMHRTARPVLVVGNQFDPATPYQGAVTAARLLPNSRLLTLHAWGHTSLFRSACADRAIGSYLLTSTPPSRGKVCQQDVVPFQRAASTSTTSPDRPASSRPTPPRW